MARVKTGKIAAHTNLLDDALHRIPPDERRTGPADQ